MRLTSKPLKVREAGSSLIRPIDPTIIIISKYCSALLIIFAGRVILQQLKRNIVVFHACIIVYLMVTILFIFFFNQKIITVINVWPQIIFTW